MWLKRGPRFACENRSKDAGSHGQLLINFVQLHRLGRKPTLFCLLLPPNRHFLGRKVYMYVSSNWYPVHCRPPISDNWDDLSWLTSVLFGWVFASILDSRNTHPTLAWLLSSSYYNDTGTQLEVISLIYFHITLITVPILFLDDVNRF